MLSGGPASFRSAANIAVPTSMLGAPRCFPAAGQHVFSALQRNARPKWSRFNAAIPTDLEDKETTETDKAEKLALLNAMLKRSKSPRGRSPDRSRSSSPSQSRIRRISSILETSLSQSSDSKFSDLSSAAHSSNADTASTSGCMAAASYEVPLRHGAEHASSDTLSAEASTASTSSSGMSLHVSVDHASTSCMHSLNGNSHATEATVHSSPSLTHTPSDPQLSQPSSCLQPPQAHEVQPQQQQETEAAGTIPRPILVISFVSATLTMASCVFNTLLPIYMVTELKMSMQNLGMFEGFLEAFSYVVRMFSGVVSDMMTSRKAAITLGFAMGAMAKFGMSGAATVGQLFTAKAVDRLANGVQAAPRDALISDLAPSTSRSSCFGFAQSMRKWGSAVGAILAFFLMKASNNNYKLIFTMAATVSLCSCAAFVLLVPSHKNPAQQQAAPAAATIAAAEVPASLASTGLNQPQHLQQQAQAKQAGFSISKFMKDVAGMGAPFYRMLMIVSLYGLGHINESLLEARAMEVGFGKAEASLVVFALSFMIFLCAYPLGRLDDKFGARTTFAVGMGALALGDLTLLFAGQFPLAVFASCIFLGVHWAVIQGPMLSIVVGLAPSNLRGTAFGIFYTVMALTAVAANSVFGTLWHTCGANSAFSVSAAIMACTLCALPMLLPRQKEAASSKLAPA